MFGVNEFGYGVYTPPTIGMNKAEWTDYVVDVPTIYEHCLDSGDADDNFPGWTHTLTDGENALSEQHQMASAISIPEGYTVTLYKLPLDSSDNPEATDVKELKGPLNVDCFTEFSLNDKVSRIVVAKIKLDCAKTNQDTKDDGTCGDCAEGYVLDEDTDSDTLGQCIEEDNTLMYAAIGGAALLLLVLVMK